jgi:hypothetical protein
VKITKSLQAYWARQYKLEVKRQESAATKKELIKRAAQKEIETVRYEQHAAKLYLIRQSQLGKNIDRMC